MNWRRIIDLNIRETIIIMMAVAILIFSVFSYLNSARTLQLNEAQGKFLLSTEKENTLTDSTLLRQVQELRSKLAIEQTRTVAYTDTLKQRSVENQYLRQRARLDSTNYVKLRSMFSYSLMRQQFVLDTLDDKIGQYSGNLLRMEGQLNTLKFQDKAQLDSLKKLYRGSFPIKDNWLIGEVIIFGDTAVLNYHIHTPLVFSEFRVVTDGKNKRIRGTITVQNPNSVPQVEFLDEPYKEFDNREYRRQSKKTKPKHQPTMQDPQRTGNPLKK